MDTYNSTDLKQEKKFKPLKKWLVPILSALIGISLGLWLFPSQQDAQFKEWIERLEHFEQQQYQVVIDYENDKKTISQETGGWSKERSTYHVDVPLSNGEKFQFDVYFEKDRFFIDGGVSRWVQGKLPHRIHSELTPMDKPFEWSRAILHEAEEINRSEDKDRITYKAIFHNLNEFDFRGLALEEQHLSYMTMVVENDQIRTIEFFAQPKKPEEFSPTNLPGELKFKISFSEFSGDIPIVPKKAYEGEIIE
jgi:hypothetical protein